MVIRAFSLRAGFNLVKEVLVSALFIFCLTLSSKIRVYLPYSPVPITLQTLVIFLGLAFLRERAILSQIVWVILGILGVPLFSEGGGFLYLFSPNFGYILGFLVSSLFLLKVLFLRKSIHWYIFCFFLANIIIYILGLSFLILILKISFLKALYIGVFPFLYGDFLKIILASLLSRLFLSK